MDLETTFDQALKEPREESRILTRNGNINNNTKCEGNRKPMTLSAQCCEGCGKECEKKIHFETSAQNPR